jgi:hypothetical protein
MSMPASCIGWLALMSSVALSCGATRSSDNSGGTSSDSGGTSSDCAKQASAGHQIAGTKNVCTCPSTDSSTGVVGCAEGYAHRPTAPACGQPSAAPVPGGVAGSGGAGTGPFRADSFVDCTNDTSRCDQYLYGYCGDPLAGVRYCNSGCATDADCDQWSMCWCNDKLSPTGGVCIPSGGCKLDRDCGDGFFCATYSDGCGELPDRFHCQLPTDLCESSSDCPNHESCVLGAAPPTGSGGNGNVGPTRRQCEDETGVVCSR